MHCEVVTAAPLRLMIFSSISALTETEAVCNGGPVDSFLSNFLLSESYMGRRKLKYRIRNID